MGRARGERSRGRDGFYWALRIISIPMLILLTVLVLVYLDQLGGVAERTSTTVGGALLGISGLLWWIQGSRQASSVDGSVSWMDTLRRFSGGIGLVLFIAGMTVMLLNL